MGRPFIDISGQTFGRLKVIKYTRRKNSYTMFLCKCECGNEKEVSSHHLKRGNTISCGCYQKEKNHEKKHGETGTKIYGLWSSIKQRCYNPKNQAFDNYGGRGIKMCDEWQDFISFKKWLMKSGYKEGLTLERLDFNSDYTPENCTFIPLEQQTKNTRRNLFIEYNGKKMIMSDWAIETGINYRTLLSRYRSGIRPPELFSPLKRNKKH